MFPGYFSPNINASAGSFLKIDGTNSPIADINFDGYAIDNLKQVTDYLLVVVLDVVNRTLIDEKGKDVFSFNVGFNFKRVESNDADLVIDVSDVFVVFNGVTVVRNATLPKASSSGVGHMIIIKVNSSVVLNTGYLKIIPNGADTIDAEVLQYLNSPFSSVILISDGVSNWDMI